MSAVMHDTLYQSLDTTADNFCALLTKIHAFKAVCLTRINVERLSDTRIGTSKQQLSRIKQFLLGTHTFLGEQTSMRACTCAYIVGYIVWVTYMQARHGLTRSEQHVLSKWQAYTVYTPNFLSAILELQVQTTSSFTSAEQCECCEENLYNLQLCACIGMCMHICTSNGPSPSYTDRAACIEDVGLHKEFAITKVCSAEPNFSVTVRQRKFL